MFTELKKPRTPRVMYWDLEIQGIIADVDCYVRADPDGKSIHDAREALLLTQRFVDWRVAERKLGKVGRTWLDSWIHRRGGLRLCARRLCGLWNWEDWNAIVPSRPDQDGAGPELQLQRPRGHSLTSIIVRDTFLKASRRCSSHWQRAEIEWQLRVESKTPTLNSGPCQLPVSEFTCDDRVFTSRPCPPLSLSMLAFAGELTASSDNGWCPAPESGSFVQTKLLAPWRGGLVRTPLAELHEADAPLAVAVLVDRSGSTSAIVEPLWQAACALVKALRDAGHAAALDWWDDIGIPAGKASRPLLGWYEAEQLFEPPEKSLVGGTLLKQSCLPRMVRLFDSAPVGVRRACVVVTDGCTRDSDRHQFLKAAQAPCVYIVVDGLTSQPQRFLPPETEGWAARIASDGSDIMRDLSGEQLLAGLLQS